VAVVTTDGTDLGPTAAATGWEFETVPAGGLGDTTAELLLVTAGLPSDPSLLTEALSLVLGDPACGCVTVAEHTVLFRRCALEAAQGFAEVDLTAVTEAVVDRVEALGWRVWETDEG
jgi:hypothetical protein